jgi:predicted AlkP superfamily pyrophosphatase or phosphodiesterase
MVFDYIGELKKAGLYDDATIIITADHGLNPGQIDALHTAGVECDETKSNPIFFIKKKGERHEELLPDSKPVSLDQFFDTIMICIDKDWENKYYGTIWD